MVKKKDCGSVGILYIRVYDLLFNDLRGIMFCSIVLLFEQQTHSNENDNSVCVPLHFLLNRRPVATVMLI